MSRQPYSYVTNYYYIIPCYYFAGNSHTTYYELTSIYGHDTFMLDVSNVGVAIKVMQCWLIIIITML